jgi:hypothetical protein
LPVIERLAQEYGDDVAIVAVAWKSTMALTAARAEELIPSGKSRWGLDENESVFELYGVPYQPASVLIRDGVIVDSWFGAKSEFEMRAALEALLGRSPAG